MATGVALSQRNVSVAIFEKSPSLRKVGAAIGLYPNGLSALEYISKDVYHRVLQESTPTKTFERRDLDDRHLQTTEVQEIKATSPVMFAWYLLQKYLAEALPDNTLHLGYSCHSFQVDGCDSRVSVKFFDSSSSSSCTKTCRVLIGADGIHSTVRKQLFSSPSVTYYQKVMYRAAVESRRFQDAQISCPPPGTQVTYQGEERGKSFSFRETTQGIMTVTGAAVSVTQHGNENERKEGSDNNHNNLSDLRKRRFQACFDEYPSVVHEIINLLDTQSIHEDFIRDITIPESWSKGPVIILGDSAHAMTPHMGQGANMSFEDVCVLVQELVPALDLHKTEQADRDKNEAMGMSISEALENTWKRRIERVSEVQERSRMNTLQSNTFDKTSSSIPFERRKYSESFKDRLYNWRPEIVSG